MWCGSRASLKKIASNDLSLRVGNDVITPVLRGINALALLYFAKIGGGMYAG